MAEPFAMLHRLMSAGQLDAEAFAQLWRATAAAAARAAAAKEGGEAANGRQVQRLPWSAAEKCALRRFMARHGSAGYPFHDRTKSSPLVPQHQQH
jgi:hypothetical protein